MGGRAAHLEVVAGKAVGMSIIVEDELLIGRHAEGAGRLAEDEEISRSHARVSIERPGVCAIEDLGSTNGTYVNGLRISALKTLSEDDRIEIGATTLVVRELPQVEESNVGAAPSAPETMPRPVAAPAAEAPPPPKPPGGETAPEQLSLRVEVDLAERYAALHMGGRSEPVLITFDGHNWRARAGTGSRELDDPGTPSPELEP
jgi:hypothetical protein